MKSWFAVLISIAVILLFQTADSQQILTQSIRYITQELASNEKATEIIEFQTALIQQINSKMPQGLDLFCDYTIFSPESVLVKESAHDWQVGDLFVHNGFSFALLIAIAVLSGFFLGNSFRSCNNEPDSPLPAITLPPRRRSIAEKEKQTLFEFMSENRSSPKMAKEKPSQVTIRINYDNAPEALSNFTLHLPSNSQKSNKHESTTENKLIKDSVNKYEKLLQNGHGARNFEVVSMLGRGGFGSVFKARHLLDEQYYAIKVIRIKVGLNQSLYEHKAFREVLSMMQLNSKHVLRYYNCWLESEGDHNIRSTESTDQKDEESESSELSSSSSSLASISEPYFQLNLNIQMEYSKGCTLKNWLERPERGIERRENVLLFRQLLKGVLHIHQCNFIHRDLKPANIFVDKELCVKIGDFGLAVINNYLEAEPSTPLEKAHSSNVGSPLYLAPEQENGFSYDEKVDVYPLGMILLELCVKMETDHERYLLLKTLRYKHELPKEVVEKFGVESEMILWLTAKDPSDRPSISEIMKSKLMERWESEFQLSPLNHNL